MSMALKCKNKFLITAIVGARTTFVSKASTDSNTHSNVAPPVQVRSKV